MEFPIIKVMLRYLADLYEKIKYCFEEPDFQYYLPIK
jgi:hypothetical protein